MTPGLADETAGPERAGEEAAPAGGDTPGGETAAPEAELPTPPEAEAVPEGAEEPAPEDPVTQLTRERDEYLELAQRTKAEFDNYRKRVSAESAQAVLRGRAEVAEGVIEALDNLERAMAAEGVSARAAIENGFPEGAPVTLQGIVVAYRDLVGALARAGIEQFDPTGGEFDPNLHEALQAIQTGIILSNTTNGN